MATTFAGKDIMISRRAVSGQRASVDRTLQEKPKRDEEEEPRDLLLEEWNVIERETDRRCESGRSVRQW